MYSNMAWVQCREVFWQTVNGHYIQKEQFCFHLSKQLCTPSISPSFGQLLLGLENYNSCLEVLFCCCRTFLGLIVINQAHFCLFVWRASWHFVQITQNLPIVLLWALLLFWKGGVVIQKLIVMQIMQIETCLQCLSLPRYLFYLQFKAFLKRSDISTRKSQKCAFSCTAAIFLHTTV